jgi:NDP-sugar pyrophosphorylase family protein
MRAFVLAGGVGTRLRPLLNDRPKCLAPIGGRPFLEYQLLWLKSKGIREVVLCVGHRKQQVISRIGDGAQWDLSVHYSVEEQPLGTGGALRRAEPFVTEEQFLTLNGDSLLDFDLNALADFHHQRRALASLVVVPAPPSRRYGAVELDDTGQILGFFEKQGAQTDPQGNNHLKWISAGAYLFGKNVLDYIPSAMKVSLEEEIFPKLIGHNFYGFPSEGYFIDIGVPEDYRRAQIELPKRFPLC